jgi:predicted RNA-binding Zn ribbon-like protein
VLDFAATLMFRAGPDAPLELLRKPADLAAWLVEAAVLDELPAVRDSDLTGAAALREAVYGLSEASAKGRLLDSAHLRLLNKVAAGAPVSTELVWPGRSTRRGGTNAALATLARETVALLGGPDAGRVRQCGRPGCTRLYVDRSRGDNRQWCGMRECGNRVNAAAYRSRRRLAS